MQIVTKNQLSHFCPNCLQFVSNLSPKSGFINSFLDTRCSAKSGTKLLKFNTRFNTCFRQEYSLYSPKYRTNVLYRHCLRYTILKRQNSRFGARLAVPFCLTNSIYHLMLSIQCLYNTFAWYLSKYKPYSCLKHVLQLVTLLL